MIFKSLFKPKWKHKNPQVRSQALRDLDASLPEHQAIFRDTLKNDADPVIRQTVLRLLADLVLLFEVAKHDADATVREHAQTRLRRLLSGVEADSPGLDERIAFLTSHDDTKLLEHLARQGHEASLREALMLRLNRDALYGDMAIQDVDADLRYTALGHVSQRNTLERVLKGARSKDKRVRLAAQARLNELKQQDERPEQLIQQAKQLCARLDSLLVSLKVEPDSIRLRAQRQEIDKEWRGIESAWVDESLGLWDEKLTERYKRASETVDKLLVGYAEQAERKAAQEHALEPIRQEKQRIYSGLSETLTQLESLESIDSSQQQQIAAVLTQAENQWRLAGELPAEENRKTNNAYQEVVNKLQRRAEDVKRYLKAVATCENVLKKAQEDNAADSYKNLAAVEKIWASLERPQQLQLPEGLLAKTQSVVEALRTAKQKSELNREKSLLAFKENTDALEKALVAGQYKQAHKLTRQLHNAMKSMQSQDVKTLRDNGEYARYQRAAAQLKELREWQGWAASPIRETLCQEAEALASEVETCGQSAAYDFHAASKKVQLARQRWKTLGPAEGDSDDMWDRFNQACNRAYEQCQKVFNQEAETREQNLVAKEALCIELEEFYKNKVESASSEVIDWKEMDRIIAMALQGWKKTGPVRRQSHAQVRDRFNDIVQRIKAVLKEERDRNKQKKQDLILSAEKVAEALAQSDKSPLSLRDSATAIKLIQTSWKEVGYATDERKLWAQFRVACDNIFNERQAQFDFQINEQREHLNHKQTLCELVERIAELTGDDLINAGSRVEEIKDEWHGVGDVPNDAKEIDKRFHKACRGYELALKKHAQSLKVSQRQELYTMHELCVRLEILADELLDNKVQADEVSSQLELITQTWSALMRNEHDDVAATLDQRYQKVVTLLEVLTSGGEADTQELEALRSEQQQNYMNKLEWCLALEIIAGVESPPECEQDRIALQVQMLARKHGQDIAADSQLVDSIKEIENKWYATGSTSALKTVKLERRFSQARTASRAGDYSHDRHSMQAQA